MKPPSSSSDESSCLSDDVVIVEVIIAAVDVVNICDFMGIGVDFSIVGIRSQNSRGEGIIIGISSCIISMNSSSGSIMLIVEISVALVICVGGSLNEIIGVESFVETSVFSDDAFEIELT